MSIFRNIAHLGSGIEKHSKDPLQRNTLPAASTRRTFDRLPEELSVDEGQRKAAMKLNEAPGPERKSMRLHACTKDGGMWLKMGIASTYRLVVTCFFR